MDEVINYSEPEFSLPEDKKDKKWHMQYARYFSTFYDCDFRDGISDSDDPLENLSPISKARKLASYWSGTQENLNYNHLTQDISGQNLHSVWIKGKKVHGLMTHILGSYAQMLVGKELNVVNLTPDVQNKKSRLFNKLMFRYDKQGIDLFKDLENMGVTFTPLPGQEFDGVESIERFMEYDWKETGQVTGADIAIDVEERNNSNSIYIQALLNYAAANYCAVYNYAINGQVYQKNIPFKDLVFVPSTDEDPYNANMQAIGFYEDMTPREVLSKYGDVMEEESIKKVKEYNSKGSFNGMEAFNNNVTYFNTHTKTIKVLNMFWIGEHDLRYEQVINDEGEISYTKNKKKFSDTRSKYIISDIHKCVLIGNIDCVNYGYDNNVVRNSKKEPELPIKMLSGRTLFNTGVSIIGKIHQSQDRIDALKYKIMLLVGQSNGKSHVINGEKVDGTTAELVTDLKTMGITVVKPSGNSGDATDAKRLVETIDWSLDPNILLLRDLYLEEERTMEEATSVSKIALGMQSNVLGKAVQQNSIARSTLGLATIYEDFIKFNEINLQYCMNLSKLVLTADGDYEGVFMTGDRGVKWMKVTKEFSYSDLLLFIKVKDTIDAEAKARLNQYIFAYMQNPEAGDQILDALKLEQATSWTAAINTIEYSIKHRHKIQAMQAQAQAQREDAQRKEEMTNENGKTLLKEQSATQRTAMQGHAAIQKEIVKGNNQPQPTPPQE